MDFKWSCVVIVGVWMKYGVRQPAIARLERMQATPQIS